MGTDAQLISRHLQGDRQASQALVERYQDLVYSLAWRMLGDAEEARDAAQETFLSALEALPRFRGECAFSTWLYRIAANTCIARCRRCRQRRAREVPAEGWDHPDERSPSSLELVVLWTWGIWKKKALFIRLGTGFFLSRLTLGLILWGGRFRIGVRDQQQVVRIHGGWRFR